MYINKHNGNIVNDVKFTFHEGKKEVWFTSHGIRTVLSFEVFMRDFDEVDDEHTHH